MFDLFPLAVALIGSSLAALFDLKTTEIPDEVFYAMIAFGSIPIFYKCLALFNIFPFLLSATVGLALLAFGFLMYKTGQWGGADAKLLATIGFLLPEPPSGFAETIFPFPLSYLINVFLVGAAYMLFYALILALIKREIIKKFSEDMKASSKVFLFGSFFLFILFFFLNLFLVKQLQLSFDPAFLFKGSIFPLILTLALFAIWRFAKAVEDVGFKKKIPISKLKVGDVLLSSKIWEGITEKELKDVKRKKKNYVWVKEGVRFAPTFPLTLLFTLYFGDGILLFMKFLI